MQRDVQSNLIYSNKTVSSSNNMELAKDVEERTHGGITMIQSGACSIDVQMRIGRSNRRKLIQMSMKLVHVQSLPPCSSAHHTNTLVAIRLHHLHDFKRMIFFQQNREKYSGRREQCLE